MQLDKDFGLSDAANYKCTVESFAISHAQLLVRAYNPILEDRKYLHFIDVHYFDGPIRWQGLTTSTDDVSNMAISLWHQLQPNANERAIDYFSSQYSKLYVISAAPLTIRILAASSIRISDSIPEWLPKKDKS
jgi:hypothetical protein